MQHVFCIRVIVIFKKFAYSQSRPTLQPPTHTSRIHAHRASAFTRSAELLFAHDTLHISALISSVPNVSRQGSGTTGSAATPSTPTPPTTLPTMHVHCHHTHTHLAYTMLHANMRARVIGARTSPIVCGVPKLMRNL